MLRLYDHPFSPYAQKVKIALREKGQAFEAPLPQGIGAGGAAGEFIEANPRGEVPTLIDGEVRLFDSTIILERPKLKDFRTAIRDNLARVLRLPAGCVGVKFKTAEKVGPVGEGRSCEAQATVLISRARPGV